MFLANLHAISLTYLLGNCIIDSFASMILRLILIDIIECDYFART